MWYLGIFPSHSNNIFISNKDDQLKLVSISETYRLKNIIIFCLTFQAVFILIYLLGQSQAQQAFLDQTY